MTRHWGEISLQTRSNWLGRDLLFTSGLELIRAVLSRPFVCCSILMLRIALCQSQRVWPRQYRLAGVGPIYHIHSCLSLRCRFVRTLSYIRLRVAGRIDRRDGMQTLISDAPFIRAPQRFRTQKRPIAVGRRRIFTSTGLRLSGCGRFAYGAWSTSSRGGCCWGSSRGGLLAQVH